MSNVMFVVVVASFTHTNILLKDPFEINITRIDPFISTSQAMRLNRGDLIGLSFDHMIISLALKAIGLIGAVACFAVEFGGLKNSFDDRQFHILSRHPITFYYCIRLLGIFTAFVVAEMVI